MAKRIKILFTIPNFDTAGSGKVVYDLVKGLDKTQFEPEICCFHNRGDYFETIKKLGAKIHLFQFATSYRPFLTLPFRILKIGMFFKKHQFDIIHSWHWSSDFTEPLAAKLANIPFVYTKKAMGWGNKSWSWRSKLSTRIITINKDMLRQFFEGMSYKVDFIPLGVDTNYYKPQEKDISLAKTLGIKDADFVVITVANLVPVKGVEVLIEAIKEINDVSVKLLIVGNYDTDYGYDLKNKYECSEIIFIGKKSDVRPYLSLAHVFVIPTKNEGRREGLPIAPIEAMASGKIVIGSKVSGIKDILEPFSEYVFNPSDVEGLVIKINCVRNMTIEQRKQKSDELISYVNNKYTFDKCITSHEAMFNEIMKS